MDGLERSSQGPVPAPLPAYLTVQPIWSTNVLLYYLTVKGDIDLVLIMGQALCRTLDMHDSMDTSGLNKVLERSLSEIGL